ncbi:MAG: hypothetical protein RI894_2004 [Bacteroidota bacterium]
MFNKIKFLKTAIFILLFQNIALSNTISGRITDTKKELLSFVTIYVKNTTIGTTSNSMGEYSLDLPKGEYDLVFQYVGYKTKVEHISLQIKPLHLDISLVEEDLLLSEVTVKANAEDPAYRIIRNMIKQRKIRLKAVTNSECDVYIKGNQKIKNAPDKIMGRDLGDLGGGLDSSRSGIVYLSESVSKLYFEQPDHFKEIMISSKVAGNDNGFSFNQAQAVNFNFYQNELDFQTKLVSPIADDALLFYRYELISSFRDKDGRLISKLKVKPKNEYGPVFGGFIYVVEDEWAIYSTDLYVTKSATGLEVLDTLHIKQTHLSFDAVGAKNWLLFQQIISFNIKVLKIETGGVFTAVFSHYKLNQSLPKGFFTPEILKVEKEANEKTPAYWDSIRPIPLTIEESRDYYRKDSLKVIRTGKHYLDSMDARRNKFGVLNLLLGYTYRNSFKKQAFSLETPLNTVQFNTVQGWRVGLGVHFRQNYDDYRIRWWEIRATLDRGFAELRPRCTLGATYHFNRTNNSEINIRGGEILQQYNAENPISEAVNSIYTLYEPINYLKTYQKQFVKTSYEQEIWNGGFLTAEAEFAHRKVVENRVLSLSKDGKDVPMPANLPETADAYALFGESHNLRFSATLRIKFDQSFIMYPERKIIVDDGKYPTIYVRYTGGYAANDYHQLAVKTTYDVPTGVVGTSQFNLEGGYFLKSPLYFYDYQHFNGNQTILGNPNNYLNNFLQLPYYRYSVGSNWYAHAHYEHNFGTFLFNKLPLIKKLQFTAHIGANALLTPAMPQPYYGVNAGIGNIGWGIIRLLRVDYTLSRNTEGLWQPGFMIGLAL